MKIAVIGGAGVRTPLLVNGLARSDLPIEEIALYDVDAPRLAAIAPLAASYSRAVRACDDARACVAGAAFVFLSIRPGGIAARARDEEIAVAHGVVGQETVGAAGFAMAMRSVPAAVEYARLVEREAPDAWIVNFTNPVGIVTQAMLSSTSTRAIGICDTPTELFEEVAHVLGLESARCFFDYFGLNHLGWLREVYCDGVPQLGALWDDDERLARVHRVPLFEPGFIRSLRLLPTDYLFYYYRPDTALANVRRAGQTRGSSLALLNERLFQDLRRPGADGRAVYEGYLAERNAGYLQIEANARLKPRAPSDGASADSASADGASADGARGFSRAATLTGYDKIALAVVRAIHFDSNGIIPLNVRNRGALPDLAPDDVVEVPCVLNANGARPFAAGDAPAAVRDLLVRVKEYERLTIRAAATRRGDDAIDALAHHPLVGERALAARLVSALQPW